MISHRPIVWLSGQDAYPTRVKLHRLSYAIASTSSFAGYGESNPNHVSSYAQNTHDRLSPIAPYSLLLTPHSSLLTSKPWHTPDTAAEYSYPN